MSIAIQSDRVVMVIWTKLQPSLFSDQHTSYRLSEENIHRCRSLPCHKGHCLCNFSFLWDKSVWLTLTILYDTNSVDDESNHELQLCGAYYIEAFYRFLLKYIRVSVKLHVIVIPLISIEFYSNIVLSVVPYHKIRILWCMYNYFLLIDVLDQQDCTTTLQMKEILHVSSTYKYSVNYIRGTSHPIC